MNNRILLILKYKDISAGKFADEIDVLRSSVSHILSQRNKPSLEFIQKILKKYPEISPEWLISGKGAMLKNPELFSNNELLNTQKSESKHIVEDTKDSTTQTKAEKKEKKSITEEMPEKIISDNFQRRKKIEKILVFYTDKTFVEYFPED